MSRKLTLPSAGQVFGYLTVQSPIVVVWIAGQRSVRCICRYDARRTSCLVQAAGASIPAAATVTRNKSGAG